MVLWVAFTWKPSHGSDFSLMMTENAWLADYHTADGQTSLVVLYPTADLFTAVGDFRIDEVARHPPPLRAGEYCQ